MSQLTPSQSAAIVAQGNVLMTAGAGSGKTSTLVQRCLHHVLDAPNPVAVDQLLMVTFTEAAAAEMRQRIREALFSRQQGALTDQRVAEQLALLDQAHIGTLHGFCLRLVQEHFHELGLDPQSRVLDEGECAQLISEALAEVLDSHYGNPNPGSRRIHELIEIHGGGADDSISQLVTATYRFLQTLPSPEEWIRGERQRWATFDQARAENDLLEAIKSYRVGWNSRLRVQPAENTKAHEAAQLVDDLGSARCRNSAREILSRLQELDVAPWPPKRKTAFRKPIAVVFDEVAEWQTYCEGADLETDSLREDFLRMQPHVLALLDLVEDFTIAYAHRKRQLAGMDFNDLEQFSLKLLYDQDSGVPSRIASAWRNRIKLVFVDEYQDINEAQDRIIAAVSRTGRDANRFLVGDVKQSIYGFRLARPDIFVNYANCWANSTSTETCRVLPLSDNFRSHETVVEFVNAVFSRAMAGSIGGVDYPQDAHLQFGAPESRKVMARQSDSPPRVELLCRLSDELTPSSGREESTEAELTNAEREAQVAAARLIELRDSQFNIYDREEENLRPVQWGDMAVLLRATAGKAEIYARVFAKAGVPLSVRRSGFQEQPEISDLVALLALLDNPLQDIPLLAVLRSPLVGLSPDELVAVRLSAPHETHFWTALNHYSNHATGHSSDRRRIDAFLQSFAHWREQTRHHSLSQCLENILEATRYADWWAAQPNGTAALENIERLLDRVRHHDNAGAGRGLHRLMEQLRLEETENGDRETRSTTTADAVQLMTIHKSKGLEFPVVMLADLGKRMQHDTPQAGMLIDEHLGVCTTIHDPQRSFSYPSVALKWAALRRKERVIAEELRLLYVGMTRARDQLFLLATTTTTKLTTWSEQPFHDDHVRTAGSLFDFVGPMIHELTGKTSWYELTEGTSRLLNWQFRGDTPPVRGTTEDAVMGPLPNPATVDVRQLRKRIQFSYPFLEATNHVGKTTVTRIRRQWAEADQEEAGSLFADASIAATPHRTPRTIPPGTLTASDVGIAYHTFFQRVRLDHTTDRKRLSGELERLKSSGFLSIAEAAAVDVDRVHGFWAGAVGRSFLQEPEALRREMPFTAAFAQSELRTFSGADELSDQPDDIVIVQGIVDLVSIRSNEVWILDYKSDRIDAEDIPQRVQAYQPQIQLYRRALERICQRPVTRLWLHFLHPGQTFEVLLTTAAS